MTLKIMAPVDNPRDVTPVIEAGAGELYCGFMPSQWTQRYTYAVSLNRREWPSSQVRTIEELEEVVSLAHRSKVEVYVAMNAHYYTEREQRLIGPILETLADGKVDGVIVADMGMLLTIRDMGLRFKLTMSGEGETNNSEIARFYKEQGVDRIIFPRHLTVEEISGVIRGVPKLEYEAFIINEYCPFNGGYCTTTHGFIPSNFCQYPWKHAYFSHQNAGQLLRDAEQDKVKRHKADYEEWLSPFLFQGTTRGVPVNACGLCATESLMRAGVHALKIPGRGVPRREKLNVVRAVKQVLSKIDEGVTGKELLSFCRRLRDTPRSCDLGYGCYYRRRGDTIA